jgi:hypothetical protein
MSFSGSAESEQRFGSQQADSSQGAGGSSQDWEEHAAGVKRKRGGDSDTALSMGPKKRP